MTQTTGTRTATPPSDPAEYRKLVQQVADKVWALWREELRRERERRGSEVSTCHP
jgi:hypothetical protein